MSLTHSNFKCLSYCVSRLTTIKIRKLFLLIRVLCLIVRDEQNDIMLFENYGVMKDAITQCVHNHS